MKRELAWSCGSMVAGAALCVMAPEYGFGPWPLFTVIEHAATGLIRLAREQSSDCVVCETHNYQ